ncbi:hypothetical protein Vadar_031502 [Vaccinium darrowii]|uniref:Uncharacterized protein n=1 Tax=Vaccinium darrowii TaxID=229202 RepID=A0ACB7XUR2_9ERIC|nr:hypothetical protein Vadar_031502 [Vaccinium darrowii]
MPNYTIHEENRTSDNGESVDHRNQGFVLQNSNHLKASLMVYIGRNTLQVSKSMIKESNPSLQFLHQDGISQAVINHNMAGKRYNLYLRTEIHGSHTVNDIRLARGTISTSDRKSMNHIRSTKRKAAETQQAIEDDEAEQTHKQERVCQMLENAMPINCNRRTEETQLITKHEAYQTHERKLEEDCDTMGDCCNNPKLPIHIVIDILLRLPIKTLFSFCRVCKEWLCLISDPHFANLHLSKSQPTLLLKPINHSEEEEEEGRKRRKKKKKEEEEEEEEEELLPGKEVRSIRDQTAGTFTPLNCFK